MIALLKLKLAEVLRAVTPLFASVCVLQAVLVHAPLAVFLQFLVGSFLAIAGMQFLFAGIDLGVLPMGRFIGAALPGRRSLSLIVGVTFALGFAATVAEPDVLVLAEQVQGVSGGSAGGMYLVYAIAAGVGVFAVLALLRILWNIRMTYILAAVIGLVLVLSLLSRPEMVPLAYDAGSVTTGVMTATVLLAVALGLTSVLAQRSSMSDGFGLLGLASLGPIVVLLVLGLFLR